MGDHGVPLDFTPSSVRDSEPRRLQAHLSVPLLVLREGTVCLSGGDLGYQLR